MAVVKIPARNIIFQVQAADGVTWLPVGGMTEVTVDPSANSATADTTTFDSGGVYEQRVMQRGAMITLAGFVLKDSITGVQDTGQTRVDFLAAQTGESSLGTVRFRHPMDTQWKNWGATFEGSAFGGKNNDESSWGAKITRSGATTLTTAP
jgi:hypothetical protein